MNACYFDTSVFLAIINGEPTGPGIRALLRELKAQKTKIYTSILTVQEASVVALSKGVREDDLHDQISKIARIQSLTREIAVIAAHLEAGIISKMRESDLSIDQRVGINRRRRWDCIHIATALDLGCSTLYALDNGMVNKRLHLDFKGIHFLEPLPVARDLFNGATGPASIQ